MFNVVLKILKQNYPSAIYRGTIPNNKASCIVHAFSLSCYKIATFAFNYFLSENLIIGL